MIHCDLFSHWNECTWVAMAPYLTPKKVVRLLKQMPSHCFESLYRCRFSVMRELFYPLLQLNFQRLDSWLYLMREGYIPNMHSKIAFVSNDTIEYMGHVLPNVTIIRCYWDRVLGKSKCSTELKRNLTERLVLSPVVSLESGGQTGLCEVCGHKLYKSDFHTNSQCMYCVNHRRGWTLRNYKTRWFLSPPRIKAKS
jgi:hypothetical protein